MTHEKIYLGKFEGEPMRLSSPSWDCGRYRGCGYIGNKNLHTHMDGRMLSNLVDWNYYGEKREIEFAKRLEDKKTRWDLIAIFKAIYHHKERAEFLKLAGHINDLGTRLLELVGTKEEREKEIKDINKRILPALFGEVQELYEKNKEDN